MQMNFILNKELELLGEHDSITSIKPIKSDRRPLASYTSKSIDFAFSFNDQENTPSYTSKYREPNEAIKILQTHQPDQTNLQDFSKQNNNKTQKDFLQLYSKVMELEKQIYSKDSYSSTIPRNPNTFVNRTSNNFNEKENNHSHSEKYSLKDRLRTSDDLSKKSIELINKLKRKTDIMNQNARQEQNSLARDFHEEDNDLFSRREKRPISKELPKSSRKKISKRKHSESDDDSDVSFGKNNLKRNKSTKSFSGKKQKLNNNSFEMQKADYKKQMDKLKKEYNEDKTALMKERIEGLELVEKVKKLEKKMQKLEVTLYNASRIEKDYDKLIESFEKSEHIRNQQKRVLKGLNEEIAFLNEQREKQIKDSKKEDLKKIESKKIISKTNNLSKKDARGY